MKRCIDCHYRIIPGAYARCTYPDIENNDLCFLSEDGYPLCHIVREKYCGIEAKYFKERKSWVKSIWSFLTAK